MAYVISYGDQKKQETFFLKKTPAPETPDKLEWCSFTSAHRFDSHEDAQNVVDASLNNYDNICVMNIGKV